MHSLSRRIVFLSAALATLAGALVYIAPVSGSAEGDATPTYLTKMPSGYRDWRFISTAHEAGKLNSIGAVLGNDVAIKAYRAGTLPFPDGTMIVALHYSYVASEENDKVFGQPQSFVPGKPTNIQFMVKDSKKYTATGGWGFGHFQDGKPATAAFMKPCYPCHAKEAAHDFVFTQYAP
jgi:hypothetical protein